MTSDADPVPPRSIARHIYTIGHSNHSLQRFLELLRAHGIQVVVDVRSQPYSRYTPHFNGRELKASLPKEGIKYLFMGKEIGGRPDGDEFYDEQGYVLYDRVAASPVFLEGLARLERGVADYRVAVMCGEENPSECHRRLLIGRVLTDHGVEVLHIRGDGRAQTEAQLEEEEKGGPPETEQLSLFEIPAEEKPWRSTRSVSPRDPRSPSSEP